MYLALASRSWRSSNLDLDSSVGGVDDGWMIQSKDEIGGVELVSRVDLKNLSFIVVVKDG